MADKTIPSNEKWKGYIYAFSMFLVSAVMSLIIHQYWQIVFVLGMRIRTAIIGMVYAKVNVFKEPFNLLVYKLSFHIGRPIARPFLGLLFECGWSSCGLSSLCQPEYFATWFFSGRTPCSTRTA